jgi:methionyl-tRNA formyltransferase
MKNWITCFSQTGSEINSLIKLLNRTPEKIITNKPIEKIDEINRELVDNYFDLIYFMPSRPSEDEYEFLFTEGSVITLHGYLRIIPPSICKKFNIFNLHPAPLLVHPDLKGKDPQKKIAEQGYEYCGNTIHKCEPIVDAGEIYIEEKFKNLNYSTEQVIKLTHTKAANLWYIFLKKQLQ